MDMKGFVGAAVGAFLCLILIGGSLVTGASEKAASDQAIPFPDIPRMTKEQLKEIIDKPGLVLIDCRPVEQWRVSPQNLPGAVHEDPMEVKSWADKYPKDSTVVIY